jgi:thiamine biosynthesis lipoprotein
MSTYDPDSELSRFNRNPSTDWITVSPELHRVVAEGLRISELTGGAFDITVGPLVNLWGFGPEPRRDQVPSDGAIAQARERVGYRRLHARAEPPALKKDRADLYVDLSSGERLRRGPAGRADGSEWHRNLSGFDQRRSRAKGHNGKGNPGPSPSSGRRPASARSNA